LQKIKAMAKYIKETSRIPVKFVDELTENELFEINDRNWLNVGEIFPDYTVSNIITNDLKSKKFPKAILVIAVARYTLVEE
jgi:hypothetical protein